MAYKNKNDTRLRSSRLKHYYANKEQYLARNKKKKELNKAYINKQKDSPCVDCNNRFPSYVMDFDHINDNKTACVSKLVTYGLKRIKEEISKCDLVCANCHRIRTNKRYK